MGEKQDSLKGEILFTFRNGDTSLLNEYFIEKMNERIKKEVITLNMNCNCKKSKEDEINYKHFLHEEICEELNEIYINKNNDYGDSFSLTRKVVPNSILVRLSDKYNRLMSLLSGNKDQKVKDEKIEDTLKDLANYCIMELIEIYKDKESCDQENYTECLKTID